MTAPQRRLVDALKHCARGDAGCEKECPYASRNDKFCQRALLLAGARQIEELCSKVAEYRIEAEELRQELEAYER